MVHASRAAQSTAEKFGCNASTHPSILSGLSDHPTRRVAYLKSVREPSRFRAPAGVSFAKCVVTALLYYFVPPLGQCELDFGYKVDDVVTYLPATEAKGKHEVVGAAAYSIASLKCSIGCHGFKVPILRLWRSCGLVVNGSDRRIRLYKVAVHGVLSTALPVCESVSRRNLLQADTETSSGTLHNLDVPTVLFPPFQVPFRGPSDRRNGRILRRSAFAYNVHILLELIETTGLFMPEMPFVYTPRSSSGLGYAQESTNEQCTDIKTIAEGGAELLSDAGVNRLKKAEECYKSIAGACGFDKGVQRSQAYEGGFRLHYESGDVIPREKGGESLREMRRECKQEKLKKCGDEPGDG
ncbi:hypothetical protein F5888DRAFT_1635506 [Russula emetica]|nr:hypothetical protein F5888DRAFT_1635506 [Russula emetica]